MSFNIKSHQDVYKFALPLYDYLNLHGHTKEAGILDGAVDGCFSNNGHALEAHRQAFTEIRNSVHDLPDHYKDALDEALDVLSEDY